MIENQHNLSFPTALSFLQQTTSLINEKPQDNLKKADSSLSNHQDHSSQLLPQNQYTNIVPLIQSQQQQQIIGGEFQNQNSIQTQNNILNQVQISTQAQQLKDQILYPLFDSSLVLQQQQQQQVFTQQQAQTITQIQQGQQQQITQTYVPNQQLTSDDLSNPQNFTQQSQSLILGQSSLNQPQIAENDKNRCKVREIAQPIIQSSQFQYQNFIKEFKPCNQIINTTLQKQNNITFITSVQKHDDYSSSSHDQTCTNQGEKYFSTGKIQQHSGLTTEINGSQFNSKRSMQEIIMNNNDDSSALSNQKVTSQKRLSKKNQKNSDKSGKQFQQNIQNILQEFASYHQQTSADNQLLNLDEEIQNQQDEEINNSIELESILDLDAELNLNTTSKKRKQQHSKVVPFQRVNPYKMIKKDSNLKKEKKTKETQLEEPEFNENVTTYSIETTVKFIKKYMQSAVNEQFDKDPTKVQLFSVYYKNILDIQDLKSIVQFLNSTHKNFPESKQYAKIFRTSLRKVLAEDYKKCFYRNGVKPQKQYLESSRKIIYQLL